MTRDPEGWTLTLLDDPRKDGGLCGFPGCKKWGVGIIEDPYRKQYVCALHGLGYGSVIERTFTNQRGKYQPEITRMEDNELIDCEEVGCPQLAQFRVAFPDQGDITVCRLHSMEYAETPTVATKGKKENEMGSLRWEQVEAGFWCEVAGCGKEAPWRLGGFENTVYICTAHVWELKDLILPAYVVVPDGDSWTVKFRSSSGDLDTIMTTRKLSESDATQIAEILNRGYGE